MTTGIPDYGSLMRAEVEKVRNEFLNDRVDRATRTMENMRHWMLFYTPFVSTAFLIFAVLGYKGLSDIQANREKFDAIAGQAGTLLTNTNNRFEAMNNDFNDKFRKMTKEQEVFERQRNENQRIVEQNKTVLVGYRSQLHELEGKYAELVTNGDQIAEKQRDLSEQVNKTTTVTSGIGGIVSSSLNVPLITSVFTAVPSNKKYISGFGFGSSGHVFAKQTDGTLSIQDLSDLVSQTTTVEIPSQAIISWTDNRIICLESEVERLTGGKELPLLIQVVTSADKKSNVYSGAQILAPIGPKAVVH